MEGRGKGGGPGGGGRGPWGAEEKQTQEEASRWAVGEGLGGAKGEFLPHAGGKDQGLGRNWVMEGCQAYV